MQCVLEGVYEQEEIVRKKEIQADEEDYFRNRQCE